MPDLTSGELLKFRLLADGVQVTRSAHAAWRERFAGPLTLGEYATTAGLSLVLPGDLYVNAPLAEREDVSTLGYGDGSFFVAHGRELVPVDVIPVPAFHSRTLVDRTNGTVQPYTNFGVTHTDRVRVSPIGGCAWRCSFCDLPFEFRYRKKHEENLLDVIAAAAVDAAAPARHVLISGGTPRAPIPARPGRPASDDEAWLDEVFAAITDRSVLPVDVMMSPRRDPSHPAWLRSIGVNAVSINLEISDPDRAQQLAPAKAQLGRAYSLDYIERAVDAFGVGFVQSLLVFGAAIEPLESTLRGVQDLVDRGCVPVLSGFRPHPLTPLADAPAVTFEEMVEAYLRTREICDLASNGVRPGPRCIPCQHNTVTVPEAGTFHVELEGDLRARECVTS